ncbi:MAG: bifunctional folylpolyglutamate synthase/dihydrofolate synthase [Ruminococcaceae bacterium]|nr:bifunctional folylpolyglutamate synthase/dihydrofolate synthase [Oscillospiraceae bacterium]
MNTDFKKFANSFQAVARLQLEGISCLTKHLGNPQNDLKFIHIAGTNGKGSVCNFLQCIFTDAGFRTGRYTSPNLISVCERISVDGTLISEQDINRILSAVEDAAKKVEAEIGDFPTQFEIWTAAAFCYFKEQKCDIVILETGLGGTRDATNVIPPPLASVITSIDIDHIEYLGDTIEKIAAEKAGIIKANTDGACGLTVSAVQQSSAAKVLTEVCEQKNNRLIFSNKPISKRTTGFHEVFDYTTNDGKHFAEIECGIPGFYQPENASIAMETAHILGISEKHIRNGIESASNPGRFEILSEDPIVIYDGAHNKNGMAALSECLCRYFPQWQGATFIMAFMGDKDIGGELNILKSRGLLNNSEIFAVKVKDNPRAAEISTVCKYAKESGITVKGFPELHEAYKTAISNEKPVVICGSLYLYKDLDEVLKNV